MTLPKPPERYDARAEATRNAELEREDAKNRKVNQDIELVNSGGARLILRSPNGTRYNITVSNAGALVVTAL